MNKREAYKKISQNIEQVQKLIEECKKLSDKSGESFYFCVNGINTYGTGMTYYPDPTKICERGSKNWDKLSDEEKEKLKHNNVGWCQSNTGC